MLILGIYTYITACYCASMLNKATPIIGLTGRASAGKDTVADFICEYGRHNKRGVQKIACADQLKGVCAEVFYNAFEVPVSAFYGTQAEKEAPLDQVPGWSGRRILQYIGTEGFRHIHEDIWARATIGRARKMLEHKVCEMVVVSDVRFLSEADAIKAAGGLIVRVKRPEADKVPALHASETQLSQIAEDYVIDNQGRELYLLENLVKDFLCQLNF